MNRALFVIVGLQFMVALVVAAVFLAESGLLAAKSAMIGGAIGVIPGAFYAWRLVRSQGAAPEQLLRAHYVAEFGKLALTFVMFGAAFVWVKNVSALPLFAGYIATLLVYWAALLMFNKV